MGFILGHVKKVYDIDICGFSAKHTALRSKIKDLFDSGVGITFPSDMLVCGFEKCRSACWSGTKQINVAMSCVVYDSWFHVKSFYYNFKTKSNILIQDIEYFTPLVIITTTINEKK